MKNINVKYNRVVKYFNSLINRILLKQQTKKENNFSNKLNFKVSSFNKYIIVIISLLFSYLFYLLIPTLYDENWTQSTLEKKLLEEFKVDLSLSSDIEYEILPSPHFTIKNGKIFGQDSLEGNEIAEIEELKVFISSKNFFNKEKIKIKYILINKANFFVTKNNSDSYKEIIFNNLSSKKIKIKRSNFFIRNKKNEIISIIKIPDGSIFNNQLDLSNTLDLKGEIFNISFLLKIINDFSTSTIDQIEIDFKKINLQFSNLLSKNKKGIVEGLNIIQAFNVKLITSYRYKKNTIEFNSVDSQTKKEGINYNGEISLKPFNFAINLDLEKADLAKIINPSSIFLEIIRNGIFFNENLSAKINLNSNDLKGNKFFDSMNILLNITNGKIDLNKTILKNDDIGSLDIKNSDLFISNNKLIFSSEIVLNLDNLNNFYSLLQTPKKIRKKISNIVISFDYDFFENDVTIKSFEVDDIKNIDNAENIIQDYNNLINKNFIKSRSFINRILGIYFG